MSNQINTAYRYSNMTTNDNDNILFNPYNTLYYTCYGWFCILNMINLHTIMYIIYNYLGLQCLPDQYVCFNYNPD